MKCPVCKDVDLVISDRQGVEIDYCPECRGVWLDRGELDKIIDRSSEVVRSSSEPRRDDRPSEYRDRPQTRKKKRESFLSELFDF